jgi:hypothetical protein
MRDQARAMLAQARRDTAEMLSVRDGIARELAALTGTIDSLSSDVIS